MGGCSHGHAQGNSADKWTQANAALEFSAGIASNMTFFSWLFFSEMNGDEHRAGHYGLASLAVLISLFFAASSAYCHKQLNHHHQPDSVASSGSIQTSTAVAIAVASPHEGLVSGQRRLTTWQKAALIGDACDHTVDAAVPITVGIIAVSHFIFGNSLLHSDYFKAIVAAVVLFSAAGSYASVRTCREAMKKA